MPPSKFTVNQKPSPDIHPPTADKQDLGWDSPSNILNLATLFTPSVPQTSLLERGLSFIPRPNKLDREELQRDLHYFHRRLKLIDHFHPNTDTQYVPFTHRSHWEPDIDGLHQLTKSTITTNRRALHRYRPPADIPDNLSGAEWRALTELTHNPNIIIKPADKGSKIIIMDQQQYLLEAN